MRIYTFPKTENLFFTILQNITNVQNYVQPHSKENMLTTSFNGIISTFIRCYIETCYYNIKNKYRKKHVVIAEKHFQYISYLHNNVFLTNEHKDTIAELFCKSQRLYFAFQNLLRRWKIKRLPIAVNVDLYMNPIDPNQSNTMTIYQNGTGYRFLLTDLIKIVNSSLLNTSHMFSRPIEPKNPYTNVPFTYSILHSIYNKIRYSNFKIPLLMQLYYNSNFNISNFTYDNEAILREHTIEDYLKSSEMIVLYNDSLRLFDLFEFTKKIRVDDDFPKDVLIKVMLPYLKLYLTYTYSLSDTDKKYNSYYHLRAKLRSFVNYNSRFGQKIMVRVETNNTNTSNPFVVHKIYTATFNAKHINFYKPLSNAECYDKNDTDDEDSDGNDSVS